MLVLDGPAPRSRVALQLWPDADPEGARNNLRQRLFRLRRTAARDVVTADDVLRLADGIGHDLEPPAERLGETPQAADGELLGEPRLRRLRRARRLGRQLRANAGAPRARRRWPRSPTTSRRAANWRRRSSMPSTCSTPTRWPSRRIAA